MINKYSVVVKDNRGNSSNAGFMSKLYIGSLWFLSFTFLITYSVTAPVKYFVMAGDCNLVLPDTIFAIHVILVLIPLFSVIIFCYVQILRKVREQGRQIASTDILQSSTKQRERKLAKIVLTILTLFFLVSSSCCCNFCYISVCFGIQYQCVLNKTVLFRVLHPLRKQHNYLLFYG